MFLIILGWFMLMGGMFELSNWYKNRHSRLTKIKVFGTMAFVAMLCALHTPTDWFELPVLIILSAFAISLIEFILRKAQRYAGVHQK